jgi:hypothetical protein
MFFINLVCYIATAAHWIASLSANRPRYLFKPATTALAATTNFAAGDFVTEDSPFMCTLET